MIPVFIISGQPSAVSTQPGVAGGGSFQELEVKRKSVRTHNGYGLAAEAKSRVASTFQNTSHES
jgi:hypothetical protein